MRKLTLKKRSDLSSRRDLKLKLPNEYQVFETAQQESIVGLVTDINDESWTLRYPAILFGDGKNTTLEPIEFTPTTLILLKEGVVGYYLTDKGELRDAYATYFAKQGKEPVNV